MSKKPNGIPEHLTRQEAADALRIELRSLDRLTKNGKLKKVKLTPGRSGIPKDDFERYLAEVRGEQPGEPIYYSSVCNTFVAHLPIRGPKVGYAIGAVIERHLSMTLPGCTVTVRGKRAIIIAPQSTGYTRDDMYRALSILFGEPDHVSEGGNAPEAR
jgi:hypothetical protein